MYEIVYSKQAENDLEAILDYLKSEAGTRIARIVTERIMCRVSSLSEMPHRFVERTDLKQGLHMTHTDGYLVFYSISDSRVSIITIVSGRKNINAHILEE